MAGSIESRIQALERARESPLPLYALTFMDGSRRIMDALGVLLYLARLDAGAEARQLATAEKVKGRLPAGTAWRTLEKELADHAKKGRNQSELSEIISDRKGAYHVSTG